MSPSRWYHSFFKRRNHIPRPSSGAAHSAFHGLQIVLRVAADSLDGVPAPGLQGAIRGILFIMDNIDRANQNLTDFQELQEHLHSCKAIFVTYRIGNLPPAVKEALQTLTYDIHASSSVINQVVDRCRARRIWDSGEDAQTLLVHIRKINNALSRFQTAVSTFTAIETSESLAIHRQLLIDKLINVDGAYYNSTERAHASACLEHTREGIIKRLVDWVYDPEGPPLCWLHGMAGTGKSTIAQTVAEICVQDGILAGHFFFARDSQRRFKAEGLFTTIAHQLSGFEIRLVPHMAKAVLTDASLPEARNIYLFPRLLAKPLADLRSEVPALLFPMVVVVDALDECQTPRDVTEVLTILLNNDLCVRPRPIFKILVTSRPEPHIRTMFRSDNASEPRRGFLSCDLGQEDPRHDIELLLTKGFKDIRADRPECFSSRKRPWPEPHVFKKIAKNASGLFIYAATILKFVGDPHQHPIRQLDLVYTTRATRSAVYSELDILYRQIILQDPSLDRVHNVLGSIILVFTPLTSKQLEILLDLEEGEGLATLQWLQSILFVPSDKDRPIRLYHPSFHDFLTSKERSEDLYLDPGIQHGRLTLACSRVMQIGWSNRTALSGSRRELFQYACQYWSFHLARADLSRPAVQIKQIDFVSSHISAWLETFIHLDLLNEVADAVSEIFRSSLFEHRKELRRHLCDEIVKFGVLIANRYQHVRNVVPLYVSESLCRMARGNFVGDSYYNHHLGVILRKIHQWYPKADVLPSAITCHENALKGLANDSPDRHVFLMEAAVCRRLQFLRTRNLAHIQQGFSFLQKASLLLYDDHPNISLCYNSIGLVHTAKYDKLGGVENLDLAIDAYRRALSLASINPSFVPIISWNLGKALQKRFSSTNQNHDIIEAIKVFGEVLTHPHALPSTAFQSSVSLASCKDALAAEDALDAYFHALGLVTKLSWAAFRDNEARNLHRLAEACALQAAALSLRRQNTWAAAECVEEACCIFWIGGLNIRSPFHPLDEKQKRATDIAKIIETESSDEPMGVLFSNVAKQPSSTASLLDEFHHLTEEGQHIPPPGQRIRSLLKNMSHAFPDINGRLIILTGSNPCCDAIITERPWRDVTHVPLAVSADEVTRLGRDSKECWNSSSIVDPKNVLQQAWDKVMEPLITALKLQPSNNPSRTWWCVTGPFSDLPLHAAVDYGHRPPRYVTDYMISSYLPALSTMNTLSTRLARKPLTPSSLLFLDPFEGRWDRRATKEIEELKRIIPQSRFSLMGSTPGTLDVVLDKLRSSSGVHIAARVEQRNEDPSDCRFVLPGQKHLQLSDLLLEPCLPTFAYLSTYPESAAWATGPATCRLGYDLLDLGFNSVVARQSPLSDDEAAIATSAFYTELVSLDPNLDFTNVAKALHLASIRLRDAGEGAQLWARFIHIGM